MPHGPNTLSLLCRGSFWTSPFSVPWTVKCLELLLVNLPSLNAMSPATIQDLAFLQPVAVYVCLLGYKLDAEAFARSLAWRIPSASLVSVHVGMVRQHKVVGDSLWWRVTRTGPVRTLELIPTEVGSRIRAYMHDPACDFDRLVNPMADVHGVLRLSLGGHMLVKRIIRCRPCSYRPGPA
ncbi:hypothetical protein BKA93DRAFT_119530 [Sparassis latifolia]